MQSGGGSRPPPQVAAQSALCDPGLDPASRGQGLQPRLGILSINEAVQEPPVRLGQGAPLLGNPGLDAVEGRLLAGAEDAVRRAGHLIVIIEPE